MYGVKTEKEFAREIADKIMPDGQTHDQYDIASIGIKPVGSKPFKQFGYFILFLKKAW